MAINGKMFAHRAVNEPEVTRAPRQKKADRPFSPPELGLRESDHVRSALERHYQRLRADTAYEKGYAEFRRTELRKALAKEENLVAWLEQQTEPSPLRVRASEIKTCARQTTMRLIGFAGDPVGEDSPHWNLAALSGGQLHEELEIALKFLQLAEKSEFTVKSDANDFSGRVDVKLRGLPAILDIKTVKPEDFKEGAWAEKVTEYIAQVSPYCRLTGNTIGVILMVDRGSGKMLEFEWDVDPLFADKMLQRAAKIVEYAKARKLPKAEERERSGGKFSFKCANFCPFARLCAAQEADGSVQAALDAGKDPTTL